MDKATNIVIVGGMAAGPKTAARARRCDSHARITVIEQGQTVSEGSCGLPYFVGGQIESEAALLIRGPKYFKEVMDIDIVNGTRAVAIDRTAKELEVLDLNTNTTSKIPYDKLVIATGATPAVPRGLKGHDLKGVFTLTKLADANAILSEMTATSPKRAVVVGAGLIGIETAEAFRERGLEVSVVEALPTVFPALLDAEMASQVEKELTEKGVDLRVGQRVMSLEGDDKGHVRQVLTEKGPIDADIVLLALGARPNVELAKQAGLTIGATGGIAVNACMQTDDPDIYAGGDCVENVHRVTGEKILAPMGSTANKHGRIIGTNVTGGCDTFPGVLGTAVVKVFDVNASRVGLGESQAIAAGYDVITAIAPGSEHASYYPGAQMITAKMVVDRATGKVLGGQVVGKGEVAKRADVLVTTISLGGTVEDVANLDLAYSPPFNGAMDVLHNAANVIRNKMSGMAKSISPVKVNERICCGEEFVLLDVRSNPEWEDAHIEASQCRLMPLNKLRAEVNALPKDAEIVTMCRTSIRAYQAQRILNGEGFENVCFMDGSITAWPYAVVCKHK
ncbi:MAG: FAD-dependent oxidoreductase [Dehalococcoidia bacterium]|nr:FAD-dependent oxidoreductase [Dehalococcoidia bacterium]